MQQSEQLFGFDGRRGCADARREFLQKGLQALVVEPGRSFNDLCDPILLSGFQQLSKRFGEIVR